MVVVLLLAFGPYRVFEATYAYTCAPRPSAEQIAYVLNRPRSSPGYICRDGENGWDFICDSSADYAGQTHRHRYGVMGPPIPLFEARPRCRLKGRFRSEPRFLRRKKRGLRTSAGVLR